MLRECVQFSSLDVSLSFLWYWPRVCNVCMYVSVNLSRCEFNLKIFHTRRCRVEDFNPLRPGGVVTMAEIKKSLRESDICINGRYNLGAATSHIVFSGSTQIPRACEGLSVKRVKMKNIKGNFRATGESRGRNCFFEGDFGRKNFRRISRFCYKFARFSSGTIGRISNNGMSIFDKGPPNCRGPRDYKEVESANPLLPIMTHRVKYPRL